MGWYRADVQQHDICYFLDVMDLNYLVFLYFGTIITPALVLAAFYAHIYRVVLKQLRQIVTISPAHGTSTSGRSSSGGTMLRTLGAAQKREVKATQNLSIIVLFFMICWIPLYTINCIIAFCKDCKINSTFMKLCIILSHANSAGNPLLYAYHLKDFRAALKHLLFSIFRKEHNVNGSLHYRTSLASATGLNNYNHHRLSLRETRSPFTYSQRNRTYVESPVFFNRPTKSMSLPTPPKLLAIVPNSVAVAAATAVDNREIWRISEVPSIIEDNSNNESSGIHTRASTPFNKATSNTSSSKNCSYMNDINYDEDDDVFLDDTLPITDFHCDDIKYQNNLSDSFSKISESPVINEIKRQNNNCLSSSSPQLTRNLFLVENEMDVDKCKYKTLRSCNAIEKGEKNKRHLNISLSGEYVSPTKSIKLSPFKAVGDFLWNTSRYPRSVSLSDEGSISPQSTRKRNRSVHKNDNHSFDC